MVDPALMSPARRLTRVKGMVRESVGLSFVVPALNEADFLAPLLESIGRYTPEDVSHEVIVVDNGSEDQTVELASNHGAIVLERPGLSLGAVRNEGARAAVGRVLVFLDADVRLREAWGENIHAVIARMGSNPALVSGSACLPPLEGGWIARAWADHSARRSERTHLGTGHMIISRGGFLEVGGFDPSLATGEDFEFCRRAERNGFTLVPNSSLEVEHVRFPTSIPDFIRRERWHGGGDGRGLQAFLGSPVVRASVAFVALHVASALGLLFGPAQWRLWILLLGASGLGGLCSLGALRRGGFGDLVLFVQRTWLVYWYLWSRFVAAFGPRRSRRRTGDEEER